MLSPTSESDLSDVIKSASAPLSIRGGGTRGPGGSAPGEVLTTAALSGIVTYEPGALTLVAQTGTPVAEIEAALEAENQMLAFEPMDHRILLGTKGEPTIGGVVAANVSGPRRVSSVGACRDALLGVRFVDGRGEVLKNGGRVMKNVTGYDLTKLMCGARGTLGVLTEVSLKVLPRPAATSTVTLEDVAPEHAVEAMTVALNTPFEVTGAVAGPIEAEKPVTVHLRLEGSEASVAYRAGEVAKAVGAFGSVKLREGAGDNTLLWRDLRDMVPLAGYGLVMRTSLRPSQAMQMITEIGPRPGLRHYLDWGGGLVWTGFDGPEADAMQVASDLRGGLGPLKGHTTLVKASERVTQGIPVFQPEAPDVAALSLGLKNKFDPRGLLNPGLMER